MGLKSIFSVEMRDDQFKRFLAEFKKHREEVKELPGDWSKVSESLEKLNDSMGNLAAGLGNIHDTLQKISEDGDKLSQNSERSARSWHEMGGATEKIAHNVSGITRSLLSWTGIGTLFAGALGAGGLFGLENLAFRAGQSATSAQGLRVSTGEQRAFGVNFGRVISSPEGLLGNVASAQNDPSKWRLFASLGINDFQNKDPAELAVEVLKKAREATSKNTSIQYASALGLTDIAGLSDKDLSQLRAGNLDLATQGYRTDATSLNTSAEDGQKWLEFSVKMEKASIKLRAAMEGSLANFAPQLEHITDALVVMIDKIGQSETVKKFLDFSAKTMEHANSGTALAVGTSAVVGGIIAGPIGMVVGAGLGALGTEALRETHEDGPLLTYKHHNPGNLRAWGNNPIVDGFAQFGSDQEGTDALGKQLLLYEDRDKLRTLRQIISKYSPKEENDTEQLIKNAVARTGWKADQDLDLHDQGTMGKLRLAVIKQEGTARFAPIVRVRVDNNVGANITVNANQAAPVYGG